jgi:nucleoside-triphosphatase
MKKNIFITAKPKQGKTTLIKEIINNLRKTYKTKDIQIYGFYTQEKINPLTGKRKGFEIITLHTKKTGMLADINHTSKYKVGKYKVNLEDLNEIGVKEIKEGLRKARLIVIDEIGKMELLSQEFRDIVEKAIDSSANIILGTLGIIEDEFLKRIKQREDVILFHLSRENFKELKDKITSLIVSMI